MAMWAVRIAGSDGSTAPASWRSNSRASGPLFEGTLNQFVERAQEVAQPRGQAGLGVDAAVVLDADMQVGEVDDLHRPLRSGLNAAAACSPAASAASYRSRNAVTSSAIGT